MHKCNVIPQRRALQSATLSHLSYVSQLIVLAEKTRNPSLDILTAIHSCCVDLVATRPRWDHFLSPGPLLRQNSNVKCAAAGRILGRRSTNGKENRCPP